MTSPLQSTPPAYGRLPRNASIRALGRVRTLHFIVNCGRFVRDWLVYQGLPGAESLPLRDLRPCISDRTATTAIDPHYFYQAIWAARLIAQQRPCAHVDIGSHRDMVGMLTCLTKVTFVDIRPLRVNVEDLEIAEASILALPFDDNSIQSLSCLHVAEHIGLGRYGDPLDPLGTKSAAKELSRVLAPGGNLYFSLPLGRSRVQFNAHRIHSPAEIVEYFSGLEMKQLSAVDDACRFVRDPALGQLARSKYACGLFWFHKAATERGAA